jgi:hypothetical protein
LFALSLAGCSCGSRHHSLDRQTAEGGSSEPRAGESGGEDDHDGGTGVSGQGAFTGRDGGDRELSDPPPVEIDRSGLIRTSGRHAALLSGRPTTGIPRRIIAVDLESGESHDLSKGEKDVSYVVVSPDQSAVLYGDSMTSVDDTCSLARLLDDGVIAGRAVSGFEKEPGHRRALGWTADGRFALLSRESWVVPNGIDIVDMHANLRHFSLDGDEASGVRGDVAPKGLWFSYGVESSAQSGLGRITADGAHLIDIAGFHTVDAYAPDGDGVVYRVTVDPIQGSTRAFYRALRVAAEPHELVAADDPEAEIAPSAFSLDGDHVLATVSIDWSVSSTRRLEIHTGATTEIVAEQQDIGVLPSNDGTALFARDSAVKPTRAGLIDPLRERATVWFGTLSDSAQPDSDGGLELGTAGPRHFWFLSDDLDLTFVARADDGTAAVSVLSGKDETSFICRDLIDQAPDADRFYAMAGLGDALILIDLAHPLAARAATYRPQHGGVLRCPKWNEARDAIAFVEEVVSELPTRSYLYTAAWPEGGAPAEQPELVYQSELELELIAFKP